MRRRHRLASVAAGVCCSALALSSSALSDNWLVRVGHNSQQLGSWKVSTTHAASFQDVIDAFGAPDSCKTVARYDGLAAWEIGISLYATTLGAPGGTACTNPPGYQIDHVTVTGRRFYTSLGLHVGDAVAGLRRRYPRAGFHRGWNQGYWLVTTTGRCVIGLCTTKYVTLPKLVARVSNGRVTAFVLPVGSQGE